MNGASVYLTYLTNKGTGRNKTRVYTIEKTNEAGIYKLKLSGKIFDLDMIAFDVRGTEYDTVQIKVVEYDRDADTLLIQPKRELLDLFENIKPDEMIIISDLTFLVRRVKRWYELNGNKINLPTKEPSLGMGNIEFLPGKEPSENQKTALKTIFENRFSYVWGPPGTGKTQYVLAYCLLHYIRKGKKAAIFAPTNNAIEQVLRGVLKMTDLARIDRKKIIRLGFPTRNFADDFPEVCEVKGLMKRITEIDEKIAKVQRIIERFKLSEGIKVAQASLIKFSQIDKFVKKRNDLKAKLDDIQKDLAIKRNEFQIVQNDIQPIQHDIDKLNKTIGSVFHKIKKTFVKGNTKQELRLAELNSQLRQKNELLSLTDLELSKTVNRHTIVKSEYEDKSEASKIVFDLKQGFKGLKEGAKIVSNIDLSNYKSIEKQLEQLILNTKAQLDAADPLVAEYKSHDTVGLDEKLTRLIQERDLLASQTTEERLNSVSVIASTIDGYVYRFATEELKVDHIFVDEAGYANMVKGLTLFSNGVPITFLGDHLQLPPVCEMDDADFRKPAYRDVFVWSQSAIHIDEIFNKSKGEVCDAYLNNAVPTFVQMKESDLTETHRFGQELANVLEQHVYKKGFVSAGQQGSIVIEYLHVTNTIPRRMKRENSNEAQAIQRLVGHNQLGDFVILTPYTNQAKLIGRLLPTERDRHKILTVHRSQGREWDTVILSVSDTGNKWFTDSQNQKSKGKSLINTAVSRARKRLIIVCNCDYWRTQNNQLIKGLLDVGRPV